MNAARCIGWQDKRAMRRGGGEVRGDFNNNINNIIQQLLRSRSASRSQRMTPTSLGDGCLRSPHKLKFAGARTLETYGEADRSNECEIRTHCALKENNTTPFYTTLHHSTQREALLLYARREARGKTRIVFEEKEEKRALEI